MGLKLDPVYSFGMGGSFNLAKRTFRLLQKLTHSYLWVVFPDSLHSFIYGQVIAVK